MPKLMRPSRVAKEAFHLCIYEAKLLHQTPIHMRKASFTARQRPPKFQALLTTQSQRLRPATSFKYCDAPSSSLLPYLQLPRLHPLHLRHWPHPKSPVPTSSPTSRYASSSPSRQAAALTSSRGSLRSAWECCGNNRWWWKTSPAQAAP